MHGASKRRGKQSEYAVQLMEKQKVKYTYGVLERQFENLFHRASAKEGITGENLLKFLEARLDNVVFRLGIAPTRSGARQLVGHKHINVNGNVVNIASYQVKAGDVISVREKSKSLEAITASVAGRRINKYSWFEWDAANLTGKFLNYPNRDEIPENIKENLIVELYSK
jgi:small subunit ribosomal protein S4